MRTVVEYLDWVNLVLFTLVALVAAWLWRQGRGRAGLWAALAFGSIALVIDVGRVLPDRPMSDFEVLAGRLLFAVLVLFPYLLYRFTTEFEPPTRKLERYLGGMTIVVLLWTFIPVHFPVEDEPWTALFSAYIAAFMVHWTVLTVVVTYRLWRAGSGQPSVARRRMRLLSFASAAITAALLLAASNPPEGSAREFTITLLATLSALTFLIGLAPPPLLRMTWRRPEQERLQAAIAGLMGATSEEEVAHRVLPAMARLVGARGVSLERDDGQVIGRHGEIGGEAELRLPIHGGTLLVTPSSYAPYFGNDELKLLETLGALTGLALDRSRLFAQEREARQTLEHADELKSSFVSLAAHELRAPVASIYGLVDTLHRRGSELEEARLVEMRLMLHQQADRLRLLVEQLLDLSRLDADVVAIRPRPFAVRERVEEIVTGVAAEQRAAITLEIDPELTTVADPDAFERIVSNLLVNALRYGEPPVTVRALQLDRHLRLTVEDCGPGIPTEFIPSLFERFTRSGATSDLPGTGLGLAIARSYAQAHRGELLYEEAEPHGARFQLVLPAEAA